MLHLTKVKAISMLAGAVFASASTFASAPPYSPLATMVAEAEAVAIVRIEKIEEIPPPQPFEPRWHPNRVITVRPTDVVRGQVPESFTIRPHVSEYRNPSAKVGEAALVFLSTTQPGPDGELPAFWAAQGFLVVADLVHDGDEKAQAAARDALVAAVKASRQTSVRLWDPVLSDAALEPFLKLLESDDPLLRRWVVARGLHYAHVTPELRKRLVALLEDEDARVAANAALMLTLKNQRCAEAALAAYLQRITGVESLEPYALDVRGTLQFWNVMKRVEAMPEALAERVAAVVTDRHTPSVPLSLELRLGRDDVVLQHRSDEAFSNAVLHDLRQQFVGLPTELEMLPFRVTLHVYRDNGVVTWGGRWHR